MISAPITNCSSRCLNSIFLRDIEADIIEMIIQDIENILKDIQEEQNVTELILGKGKSLLTDPISDSSCFDLAGQDIGTEAFRLLKTHLQVST